MITLSLSRKAIPVCLSILIVGCTNNMNATDTSQSAQGTKGAAGYQVSSQQKIALQFPGGSAAWHRIDHINAAQGYKVNFVPVDQNDSNWREAINIFMVTHNSSPGETAKSLTEKEFAHAKQYCQQVDAKILSQTSHSLVYQLNIFGCPSDTNQKQVGKVFNGTDGVYQVRYSAYAGEVSPDRMNQGAKAIKSAQLVKN
ncbi:MAG TPA: hypothetical protein VHZ76_02500 [Gammaproteobacteria bacterium]|jgi:hypothetical protein|nr:hypothetical protein [Gammaproteobacteria bacterium]